MLTKRRSLAAALTTIAFAVAASPAAAVGAGDPCPVDPSICGFVEGATGFHECRSDAGMKIIVHDDIRLAERFVAGATGYPSSWGG